jgi:hypothetical protein
VKSQDRKHNHGQSPAGKENIVLTASFFSVDWPVFLPKGNRRETFNPQVIDRTSFYNMQSANVYNEKKALFIGGPKQMEVNRAVQKRDSAAVMLD